MSRKKRSTSPDQLWKWIAALALMAVLAGALAVGLKQCAGPAEPPAPRVGVPGIDVSSHQGQIDWEQVAASGVEFAMIRLGYRGYDTGSLHIDERAAENLAGARAAGLKIGAYFFSQAVDADEARQEAELALEILDGMALDMPLTYDWEYVSGDARTGDVTAQTLEQCVYVFCGAVEAAGYSPMVYFNRDLSQTRLDLRKVRQYPFWLALYEQELAFPYEVAIWQYTDQGRVPGIEGDVDLNWYYPS